jgi:type IV fimbrial biogenesis protein FimT
MTGGRFPAGGVIHAQSAASERRRGQQGFTLVEIMVTIAIIGMVSMIAIPAFSNSMLSGKLASIANSFASSAQLARSEAIKRNGTVSLCASSNGSSCSGGWTDGWIVLAGSSVISAQPALPSGFQMTGNATDIQFKSTGLVDTCTSLTLKKTSDNSQQRVLTISTTGRPKIEKTTATGCGA